MNSKDFKKILYQDKEISRIYNCEKIIWEKSDIDYSKIGFQAVIILNRRIWRPHGHGSSIQEVRREIVNLNYDTQKYFYNKFSSAANYVFDIGLALNIDSDYLKKLKESNISIWYTADQYLDSGSGSGSGSSQGQRIEKVFFDDTTAAINSLKSKYSQSIHPSFSLSATEVAERNASGNFYLTFTISFVRNHIASSNGGINGEIIKQFYCKGLNIFWEGTNQDGSWA